MRRLLKIMSFLILSFVIVGCQEGNNVNKDTKSAPGAKSNLPAFLAGTWQTDDGFHQFAFNADGSLKSVKPYFLTAPIIVTEGGGYDFFSDVDKVRCSCVLGPYSASFNPKKRWLTVEFKLDSIEIKRPWGDFNEWSIDKFEGPVSEDNKIWDAHWTNTTFIKEFDKSSNEEGEKVFKHISDK